MVNRYKVTVTIEKLADPDRWVNPESGKVERHTLVGSTPDGEPCMVDVDPPWEEVARFGAAGGVDADSFVQAMPDLIGKINGSFTQVQQYASQVD